MSKYLPEDWVLWRIDRAIDQVRAEVFKSRDDYDFLESHRAYQVLSRLEDDLKDGPVRTERQIFEDYSGPEPEVTPEKETRPMIHAHWIRRGFENGWVCSHCGSRCLLNYESDFQTSEFCPHCGAQMDEKEESNDGNTEL